MRLAILSDIHGNLAALEAVEQDLLRRGVDRVINLGDSLSGPLLPRETADFLMARDWLHLAGNHERQILETPVEQLGASDAHAYSQLRPDHLRWMAGLSPVHRLDEEVLLCHGSPTRDNEHLLATIRPDGLVPAEPAEVQQRLAGWRGALIACGHTHIPAQHVLPNGGLIVNPGSVGLQAYVDEAPYPYVVETGSPEARYAIVDRTAAGWTAEFISVAYDTEAMVRLARERGIRAWEEGLRTGFLPPDLKAAHLGVAL